MAWADDLVLLATSAHTLSPVIDELMLVLTAAGFENKLGKLRHSSLQRPCSIMVARH